MSTSYYNFLSSGGDKAREANHRQAPVSPSSFATSSSSTSNSSLNQFSSLTPTSVASSTISSSSSTSIQTSSTSSTLDSSQRCQFSGPDTSTNGVLKPAPPQTTPSTVSNVSANYNKINNRNNMVDIRSGQTHLSHSYSLHSLEPKPLKPFKTKSDYIEAMKEDLAEWLNCLYPDLDLSTENFFSQLENGSIICRHANHVTQMGRNFLAEWQQISADSARARNNGGDTGDEDKGYQSFGSQNSPPLIASTATPDPIKHSTPDAMRSSIPMSTNHHGHTPMSRGLSRSKLNNSKSYQCLPTSQCSNSLTVKVSSPDIHQTKLSLLRSPSQNSHYNLDSQQSTFQRDRSAMIDWFCIRMLPYKRDAKPGTFFARDNICQFILWCRSLNIHECLLFETDDLVARKNEKSFILCLLEVARIGFKVGLPTPLIIQLEQEIDAEIENDAKLQALAEREELQAKKDSFTCIDNNNHTEKPEDAESEEEDYGPKPQVVTNDLVSLHEKVVQLLCQCTCSTQFPMVRVGDNGKYKVGDKLIIFVRILRRHIMVRVGGGWQELSEFLRAKDPCRTRMSASNYHSRAHHGSHYSGLHTPCSAMSRSGMAESSQNLSTRGQPVSGQAGISSGSSSNHNNNGHLHIQHNYLSHHQQQTQQFSKLKRPGTFY